MTERDAVGAFVPGVDARIEGAAEGPLAGLTFAAKDLFDVAGYPTGGGNPDWGRGKPVPAAHAWAVQTLLDAGASLIGKTITDEVSLGILGDSAHFGTPLNSAAPDRVPGGSSSGSAAAVAAGLCDTAIGTDTGGSGIFECPGSRRVQGIQAWEAAQGNLPNRSSSGVGYKKAEGTAGLCL
jgi:amidase